MTAIKKSTRKILYEEFDGRCGYCSRKIEYKDMQVDHIRPIRSGGGNEIINLLCSCRKCNHYKRGKGLEGFRDLMKTLHQRINSNYINQVAMNFSLIPECQKFSGKFHFELMSERKVFQETFTINKTFQVDEKTIFILSELKE